MWGFLQFVIQSPQAALSSIATPGDGHDIRSAK